MKKYIFFICFLFSTALFSANSNWMSQIPNSRVINQLIIPGTHDSGSYAITALSKFSLSPDDPLPTWIEQVSNILPLSLVRIIAANWCRTQPYSIADQLNNGIRYLDFRIDLFQDGHFYLNHALLSVRLSDALQQIKTFIQNNPSEIVFIDINHIFNINNAENETQLVQLLQTYLGPNAIPNTFHTSDTIGTLRKSNRNVIIFMDTSQIISSLDMAKFAAHYFWHESNINSPWPNKSNMVDLKNTLDAEIAVRAQTQNNNFFVLQPIETENTHEIINGIIDPLQFPTSIENFTLSLSQHLKAWLDQYISEYKSPVINIVIQDWFTNQSDLVPLAIQYDTQVLTVTLKDQSINTKLAALKQWYRTQHTG